MKKYRHLLTLFSILLVCFIFVPVAFAHPLGNFTINHYAGLQVTSDTVAIDYVLDMAVKVIGGANYIALPSIDSVDANDKPLPDTFPFLASPWNGYTRIHINP